MTARSTAVPWQRKRRRLLPQETAQRLPRSTRKEKSNGKGNSQQQAIDNKGSEGKE